MRFLYDTLIEEFGKREIARIEVPAAIIANLSPKFGIRPYQSEAFQRFLVYQNNAFPGKPYKPTHLLYNMATGSGKTLIMAGLMLYLYEQGYRNFLFFVHSNNIIQKTRDNFLNPLSGKYLFNRQLIFNSRAVLIKEVENFDSADADAINICFTTIQQLHIDLSSAKENSLTFEDFRDRKTVLIADEAHHLNAATKKQLDAFGSWEGTVLEILNQNLDNILLEFTATLDYENREIIAKYAGKVLMRYDLAQFRQDKYSKEINLIRSHYDEEERILQALILSLYRQELAAHHNVNLKPVILFKAKRTIAESEANKERFHTLIERLTARQLEAIRDNTTLEVVQDAFRFFAKQRISTRELERRVRQAFQPHHCISANNDTEAAQAQLTLNSLEDEGNPVRAVFAVQKLNEGWDVLNLFDIVRLYEGRDGRENQPGKTTLSEAQLIGRGARYFPFTINTEQDKYKRKYDGLADEPLKVLETLFYHTKEDSKYISELKKALIDSGIYEDEANLVQRDLFLKESYRKTDSYKSGLVFHNHRVGRRYDKVHSFADLGVTAKNIIVRLSSGLGRQSSVFAFELEREDALSEKDVAVSAIPLHVSRYALTRNPFFHFDSISRYFPHLESSIQFIESNEHLGGLSLTFSGTTNRLHNLTHDDYLKGMSSLLNAIEAEIKEGTTEFEGTEEFTSSRLHNIFPKQKTIYVPKNSERADGQESVVADADWYVYNANYGTSEEKAFVKLFKRRFESLRQRFEQIHLIRNERSLKLFDSQGRGFEPDFILFCKEQGTSGYTYQVFIEPKGAHLVAGDQWKADFLKKIADTKASFAMDTDKYRITAAAMFYNEAAENDFKAELEAALEPK